MGLFATNTDRSLEKTLRRHFGYSTFRPQQREVITHLLEGKDAVVLMPTGGGKSICYQLPALVLDGLTLVVSPLIALMKDQVESLKSNGIEAAYLNSSLTPEEEQSIRIKLNQGKIKLLYVSPERLYTQSFFQSIPELNVKLFAIDEAHCVSSWGHHFRPEYKKLSALKRSFPNVPVVALTATADKAVRSDIGELLGLRNPKYFISSFDRPNLSLAVLPGQKKYEQIVKIIRRHRDSSGIIYCSSRASTERLAEKLAVAGFNADFYHAGIDAESRSKVQDDFISGRTAIICATVAFGMGIDKPDVRFVIHFNMPGNLESYYQEIGRAGRDGDPAETILFYSYRDVQTHMKFIDDISDNKYKEIQKAKLERMQEFAEGQVCRRKILMTYFGEIPEEDCKNCDVCENPPRYFDGTILAQKALSAVMRVQQKANISTLIDILKGSMSSTVKQFGFHQIKTFGAGSDITAFGWQLFFQQFIQQGIVELDYKDHYNLKLTPLSNAILFEGKQVKLVTPDTIKERQESQKKKIKKEVSTGPVDASLFEILRQLRNTLAGEINRPAYVVFSDASLRDMATKAPQSYGEFLDIHGVGEHKANQYADIFIDAIDSYLSGKQKGNAYKETADLFKEGYKITEIARMRNMQETTVYSHIAHLMTNGEKINIHELATPREISGVEEATFIYGYDDPLKHYYDHLDGKVDFGKIRIILTWLKIQEN
ncbi:DNA helicase RecQ [Puteibacter caeruleilacunae]|nr:DNA helicase RecQ [Puteibacter caeruleilacunae]